MYSGWSWSPQSIESDQISTLIEMLKVHLLPPLPATEAVWTTPFLRRGSLIPTMSLDIEVLEIAETPTGTQILGPYNAVNIIEGDKEACKVTLYLEMWQNLLKCCFSGNWICWRYIHLPTIS